MPARVPFSKPALPLDDQLALLSGRGLAIEDASRARRYLENISYYRLSGYTRYFTDPTDVKRERFRVGTTFNNVIELYVFDRKLRMILSEAFERIEVAVKGGLAYHGVMAAGPFWISDPSNFDASSHTRIMDLVNKAIALDGGKHKQMFLEAFFRKYSDPVPPAWMLTEVISFHGASILYKHIRGVIRLPVANQFGVQHDVLESWLHALVFARNVCAHHGRLWNRRFTISAKIPKGYRTIWPEASRNRVYATCVIAHHMLQQLGGDTTWHKRLRDLINSRGGVPLVDMGFPDDWEKYRFWGFVP